LEENLGLTNQYINFWLVNIIKYIINFLKSKLLNIFYLSKKKFYKYNFINIQKITKYINKYISRKLFLEIIKINGLIIKSNIKIKL